MDGDDQAVPAASKAGLPWKVGKRLWAQEQKGNITYPAKL